jgi:hypothetical protein
MLAKATLAVGIVTAMSAGCGGGRTALLNLDGGPAKPARDDAGNVLSPVQCPTGTEPHVVELTTPVKLDLLFMIDNSGSMEEEQANLARNFPRLIDELKNLPMGLPDLHLGVVSSDLGDGSWSGEGGALQVPSGCGLDPKKGRYLISQSGSNNNFDGDIAHVFACLAELGTGGSGWEQQLASVRMALSGFVPANDGFLRPDAHLAVVYITDEDDGSASPDSDTTLLPVQTFVDDMRLLLTQSISISAIAGWPNDYEAGTDAAGPDLTKSPICKSANGDAGIALRMKQFVDAFGPTGKMLSICQEDFSNAMAQIGQLVTTTVESTLVECR